jgi:hypothetical protein
MGLFAGLFGKKLSRQEQLEQAAKLMEETRQLASSSSPKKALKHLRKESRPLYSVVGLEGELHPAYAELVEHLWAQQAPRSGRLPSVKVVHWSTWAEPKFGDLHDAASRMEEDLLYCLAPLDTRSQDALSEIEALDTFANDPEIVMIVIGDENMMFRRGFLIDALQGTDRESEDIGQDLLDHAGRIGKKAEFY